jgi:hypothetical protein
MALHAFWVHGASVQVESPNFMEDSTRHGNEGNKIDTGEWGAMVHQNQSGNSFMFNPTTPVIVVGNRSCLKRVFLLYKTEGGAYLDKVEVRDHDKTIFTIGDLHCTGGNNHGDNDCNWTIPNTVKLIYGVQLRFHFKFAPKSSVLFRHAGIDVEI